MSFTEKRFPIAFLIFINGTLWEGEIEVKNSGIYCIENKVNNKVYIGQSINVHKRINTHKYLLRTGTHSNIYLQRSFDKHGKDSFDFKVIELCDVDKLNSLEKRYIKMFNSLYSQEGYNLTTGGDSNYSYSSTSKLRMRIASRERWSDDSQVINASVGKSTMTIDTIKRIKTMLYNDMTVKEVSLSCGVSENKVYRIYELKTFSYVLPELNTYLSNREHALDVREIRSMLRMYRDGNTYQSIADEHNVHIRTAMRRIKEHESKFDIVMRERRLDWERREQERRIRILLAIGKTKSAIARELKVSRNTVIKIEKEWLNGAT